MLDAMVAANTLNAGCLDVMKLKTYSMWSTTGYEKVMSKKNVWTESDLIQEFGKVSALQV